MYVRSFIAIAITEIIKERIVELIQRLVKYHADIKWVKPENLHLTLKFLGDTPEILLPKIHESLAKTITSFEPFYIRIYGTGVFPNKKYPKVIWIGLEHSSMLKTLAKEIELSMTTFGYQKERKGFNPHLTVGRVRSQKGIIDIMKDLENSQNADFGSLGVNSVDLMKSVLNPKGAEYTCLFRIPIGNMNAFNRKD
jgi:2'-5' RNA ligase